ncbi:hypothetical protein ACQ1R0_05875 [Ornithobacterium rhinotracheale]|uniref:hypothetical protein n=1 Tax=Ornithobacterium rhinotracheale TaxID=28251 RepID=UPI001FF6F846|nr:hypothetical protein [Ornithobacterium rhinotracheale]MCK0201383.1 hypothetical protein [Ornithobacterium rhinotracheale]
MSEELENKILTDTGIKITIGGRKFELKAPTLATMDRVSALGLKLKVDEEKAPLVTFTQCANDNAKICAEIIATMLLGRSYNLWKLKKLSSFIYKHLTAEEFANIYVQYLSLVGIGNFMSTMGLIKGNTTTSPNPIVESKEG